MPPDWIADIVIAGAEGASSWTEFDPVWYARRYLGGGEHAHAALADYAGDGVRRGHDPNPYFCEGWMRREQPDLINDTCPTAFVACLAGRAPFGAGHWLFDLHFFREVADELTPEWLARDGYVDLYDQFLRRGHVEGRRASVYFDPIFYLAQLDHREVGDAMRLSPYRHFLIRHSLTGAEVATSPYFNPGWYLHQNPQAVVRLARRSSFSALDDFLYVASDAAPNNFLTKPNIWLSTPTLRPMRPSAYRLAPAICISSASARDRAMRSRASIGMNRSPGRWAGTNLSANLSRVGWRAIPKMPPRPCSARKRRILRNMRRRTPSISAMRASPTSAS